MDMSPYTNEYGDKFWYDSNGELHREDGPAVEYSNGDKWWCIHGKYHREDGPAYERKNGYKEYYLEHLQYTEEEYWK